MSDILKDLEARLATLEDGDVWPEELILELIGEKK